MSLWVSLDVANVWKSFENSKSLSVKFRQKVDFFSRKGRELDDLVSWFGVYVDVEVVCVLRPSTRLCLEESAFATTSTLILTFVLLFGLLFVKGLMAEGLMAEGLMA